MVVNEFDPERLVLRRFEAYYRQSEDNYTEVILVVTADKFMHVYARDLAKPNSEQIQHRQFGFRLATVHVKTVSDIEVEVQCRPTSSTPNQSRMLSFNVYFLSETLKNGFVDYLTLIVG